jgi:hypothetical protein
MTLTPRAPLKRLKKYQLVEYMTKDNYRIVASSYDKHFLETKKELYKKLYNKTLHIIEKIV